MSPFSVQLQHLRRSRGLRQKALADLLGVDAANLSAIENGQRPPPRKNEFLEKVRVCLELSEDEFVDLKLRAEATQLLGPVVSGASPDQIDIALKFLRDLTCLRPPQLRAIGAILEMNQDTIPGVRHRLATKTN